MGKRVYIIESREAPSPVGHWSDPIIIDRLETDEVLDVCDWTAAKRHTHYKKPYWQQRRIREAPEPDEGEKR